MLSEMIYVSFDILIRFSFIYIFFCFIYQINISNPEEYSLIKDTKCVDEQNIIDNNVWTTEIIEL
jgi:hypothetical protein